MAGQQNPILKPDDIQSFKDNGFLLSSAKLFSDSSFQELKQLCENAVETEFKNQKSGAIPSFHIKFPLVLRWILSGNLLGVVEQILGPNVGMWSCSLFYKAPNSKEVAYWHQDIWGVYRFNLFESKEIINFTVAITESTQRNGGLRFLPGTHTKVYPHDFKSNDTEFITLPDMIETNLLPDLNTAVNCSLQPNQFSIHNINVVHGSNANSSELPRITLSTRFFSTAKKCNIQGFMDSGLRPLPTLVRGKDLANSGLKSLYLPDSKYEG